MSKTRFSQLGEQYGEFIVTNFVPLDEIKCCLIELEHRPTAAQVMHVAADDPENLFCLSFRTLPDSSNGAAHILEHVVLCGSEKYPIKDPFFSMQRRSLTTFMNAFTGADFTAYPAASLFPKDFYNLLSVYLDAVFKPNLKYFSFLQEGWRLEFANPENPDSPLLYKGIVYNEMKGSLSSPDRRLEETLQAALFPDVSYGCNSGGEPVKIPTLSHAELQAFHKRYYHPSRCLFFFYGNMPLEDHLDFIAKEALAGVVKVEKLPEIPKQPRFTNPKQVVSTYPVTEEHSGEEQVLVAIGWLTCPVVEQEELLALSILEIILMDSDASLLKRELLRSGLCKQVNVQIDSEYHEVPISLIFHGCKAGDSEKLEKLTLETLEKIEKAGIPAELIERAIHQVEFHKSEISGDSSPYGLSLFWRAGTVRQHGGDPKKALEIHTLCHELEEKYLRNPKQLTFFIRRYFLDNPHRVLVTLLPDQQQAAREAAQELYTLDQLQQQMTATEKNELVKRAAALTAFQQEEESKNLDILPTVKLADVLRETKEYPLDSEERGHLTVYSHQAFTNQIDYVSLGFFLPALSLEELPYVKFFSLLMSQMGCGGRSWESTLDYHQAHTGGVGVGLNLHYHTENAGRLTPMLSIHGKALHRKSDKLFPLLADMATSVDLTDCNRLRELLAKHWTLLQNHIVDNAMRYAINTSQSSAGEGGLIAYYWHGLGYYAAIKQMMQGLDQSLDALIEKLQDLQQRLLSLDQAHLVLTCAADEYARLKEAEFFGLQKLGKQPSRPWQKISSLRANPSHFRTISSSVAFNALTIPSLPYAHPDTPALCVAANLFDDIALHRAIREEGGAYGGGASNYPMSATFTFWSYRDPHIIKTFQAFEAAVAQMAAGGFDEREMEEAKLQIFQDLDSPISPGSRGHVAYARLIEGKSASIRQTYRNTLFSLGKEDVVRVVQEHIAPHLANGVAVVLGGRQLIEKERKGHLADLPLMAFEELI